MGWDDLKEIAQVLTSCFLYTAASLIYVAAATAVVVAVLRSAGVLNG